MLPTNLLTFTTNGAAAAGVKAYDSLATVNGNGTATTLTFSGISSYYSNYDELQLRCRWAFTGAGPATVATFLGFNGSSTTSDFAVHYFKGNGSSISVVGELNPPIAGIEIPASVHSNENPLGAAIISINGYNTTNKRTVVRYQSGVSLVASSTESSVTFGGGQFETTTNVTSITFKMTSDRIWTTTTEISLYGLKKA